MCGKCAHFRLVSAAFAGLWFAPSGKKQGLKQTKWNFERARVVVYTMSGALVNKYTVYIP
jgi:hypothetical protein